MPLALQYDPVSFLVGFTAAVGPKDTATGEWDDRAVDACVTATGCYPLVAVSIWQQVKDSAAEFLAAEEEHMREHHGDTPNNTR